MNSTEKYGKLKRQINRFFLPLEINPQFVIDALKIEEKKSNSPSKIRQETMNRIGE